MRRKIGLHEAHVKFVCRCACGGLISNVVIGAVLSQGRREEKVVRLVVPLLHRRAETFVKELIDLLIKVYQCFSAKRVVFVRIHLKCNN